MPRGERSPEQTQITISMPKSLLAEINAEAKRDNRSRSNWIVTELTAAIKARQLRPSPNFTPAGESIGAPAEGRSTASTRSSLRPGEDLDKQAAARTNEEPDRPRSSPGPRSKSTRGIRAISRKKP